MAKKDTPVIATLNARSAILAVAIDKKQVPTLQEMQDAPNGTHWMGKHKANEFATWLLIKHAQNSYNVVL
ncbi:MAG TPA: hypothetical protein VEA59_02955 [Patescibacteria group bacterium]|nr:hypothetical protein [Patescibacteria group bacterium]